MQNDTLARRKSEASINIKTSKSSELRKCKHCNKERLQIAHFIWDTTRNYRHDDVDTHQNQKEMKVAMK